MSFEAARAAIVGRFVDQWASTTYSTVAVGHENSPFTPPATGPYTFMSVLDGDGARISLGDRLYRYQGMVQADILLVEDSGTLTGRKIADAIELIFLDAQFGSVSTSGVITCRAGSLRALGLQAGRYRFVLRIPFHRDVRRG